MSEENERETKPTKVIFRYWENDVIALFPEDPSNIVSPRCCQSYMHLGQHGGADPFIVIQKSRPATKIEYTTLQLELEGDPYHYILDIRKRYTNDMRTARQNTWRQYTIRSHHNELESTNTR